MSNTDILAQLRLLLNKVNGDPCDASEFVALVQGTIEALEDGGGGATIEIVDVVTIEPGEEARVENTGTDQALKLVFYIPKGADGVTPTIDPTTRHWMIGGVDTGILAQGADGQDGQDGAPGHNPCLGVFADASSLPTTDVQDGDYAYADVSGVSHIFRYDSSQQTPWVDNGEGSPDSQTAFDGGAGPTVADTKIDNTQLANPASNALAKAEDVALLAAKLDGVTLDESKYPLGEEQSKAINGNNGNLCSDNYGGHFVVNLDSGTKKVRFLATEVSNQSTYPYGYCFYSDSEGTVAIQLEKYKLRAGSANQPYELIVEVPQDAVVFKFSVGSASRDSAYCYLQTGESVVDMVNNVQQAGDALDKQINGQTLAEKKVEIDVSTGESGSIGPNYYPLEEVLEVGKAYRLVINRDPNNTGTNVVNSVRVNLRNANNSSLQFKTSQKGSVRTYVDAVNSEYTLYPIDVDISKIGIYVLYSSVIVRNATFKVTFYLQEYEEVEGDIEKINNRLDEIETTSSIGMEQKASTLAGDIINLDRPYYFNNGWKSGATVKNYLEEKLRLVPRGKHFLTFSDNHVDYNGSILNSDGTAYVQVFDYGLLQKQEIIMKYVSDRLGKCKVLYGGDLIGSKEKVNGSVEQQKTVFDWFGGNMFKYFGTDFLPCLGDHDINQLRCDNNAIGEDRNTWYSYIYQTMFKSLRLSSKVEFDDRGIAAIGTLDSTVLGDYNKESYKLWMNFHYCMDDPQNKIRFIVLEDLAGYGTSDANVFSNYLGPCIQLPFVGYALNSCPDDYDVVILCHEANHTLSEGFKSTNVWEKTRLFPMFSAFKNKTSYTLSRPDITTTTTTAVFNAIMSEYGNATYDFSSKTGRIVLFRGDVHYCGATYADGGNNAIHAWTPEYTPSENDILEIIVERTTLVQNPGFTTPMSSTSNPYIDRSTMEETVKHHSLIGTPNEVLFDIVTLTDNNKVVCTRVGTSPVTRCMDIPFTVFNKDSDYVVGDVVLWDEPTVNGLGQLIPNRWTRFMYKFISNSYAANHGNDVVQDGDTVRTTFPVGYETEVEVMDVSDIPYVRSYEIAVKQEQDYA